MRIPSDRIVASCRLLLGLTVAALLGCAAPGVDPGGSVPLAQTTLMAGWEQHFTIEWTVEPYGEGTRQLRGYVNNQHGERAVDVRLLVRGLDRSGAVVSRRIDFVPGGVSGFGRAPFVIQHVGAADRYEVSVWTYTWEQSSSEDRDR